MKHCKALLLIPLLGILPAPVQAAVATAPRAGLLALTFPTLLPALVSSLAFGLLGIVLAILGFKLFDLAIPFDLEKELCENKNIAVGNPVCRHCARGLPHHRRVDELIQVLARSGFP